MIGETIGPYRVLDKLGAGGMGEVYRARDTRLGREVAIKILPTAFASDPERLSRFEQEARAAAAPGSWRKALLERDVLILAASYFCMNYVFFMFSQWLFIYLVEERGFSIALPDTWKRTKPPEGGSFAAVSDDGLGEATLWVDRDRKLSFDDFIDQSLAGLDGLGDNARVTDRVEGPTLETSIAVLEADVPVDGAVAGPYRVTLRAAGPYRYYLATSIGAGAPPRLIADAELLSTSFRPQVEVK